MVLLINFILNFIQLGSNNGHNLGVAAQNGAFSTSASIGDMFLRFK